MQDTANHSQARAECLTHDVFCVAALSTQTILDIRVELELWPCWRTCGSLFGDSAIGLLLELFLERGGVVVSEERVSVACWSCSWSLTVCGRVGGALAADSWSCSWGFTMYVRCVAAVLEELLPQTLSPWNSYRLLDLGAAADSSRRSLKQTPLRVAVA